jgi:hypothetical protein
LAVFEVAAALLEAAMRKNRPPETEAQRNARFEKQALNRSEDAAAEDKAMDAMIKRSIDLHGA